MRDQRQIPRGGDDRGRVRFGRRVIVHIFDGSTGEQTHVAAGDNRLDPHQAGRRYRHVAVGIHVHRHHAPCRVLNVNIREQLQRNVDGLEPVQYQIVPIDGLALVGTAVPVLGGIRHKDVDTGGDLDPIVRARVVDAGQIHTSGRVAAVAVDGGSVGH